MAPRGKSNPYYRTKDQLTDDVFNVLRTKSLSLGAQHAVVFEVTWLWTEFEGKYTGCKYWSKQAFQHRHDSEKDKSRLLRHDHVVPRNYIVKRLLYGEEMARESLYSFLDAHLFGCILLKGEDTKLNDMGFQREMPDGWTFGDNVWARYEVTKIDVCKVQWSGKTGTLIEE